MTVISTIISQFCVAHASDSFITRGEGKQNYEILDRESPKVICVGRWAAAMSYFGLATYDKWSTLDWLRAQTYKASQFDSPEEFALFLANGLNTEINSLGVTGKKQTGIGVHFTAYEDVDGYNIPELFQITNYDSTDYDRLLPEGIRVTRETYASAPNSDGSARISHSDPKYRHEVRKLLIGGFVYIFNNGDPGMFNIASGSIYQIIDEARKRGLLEARNDTKAHRELAMWPLELVAKIQKNFLKYGYQKVGGDLHNLSITPLGVCESDTGDCKC